MWLNMVDHLRISTAEGTARMKAQELSPQLFPFPCIATLATVWAGAVKAALAFTLALDLAGAKDTMRHDGTARAKTGRLGH